MNFPILRSVAKGKSTSFFFKPNQSHLSSMQVQELEKNEAIYATNSPGGNTTFERRAISSQPDHDEEQTLQSVIGGIEPEEHEKLKVSHW